MSKARWKVVLRGRARSTSCRVLEISTFRPIENAKNNSICAQLLRHEHIAAHDAELVGIVIKIARARTNHNMQCNRNFLSRCRNQSGAGRYSAFQEGAAQFHAFCSTSLGGNADSNESTHTSTISSLFTRSFTASSTSRPCPFATPPTDKTCLATELPRATEVRNVERSMV